MSSEAKLKVGIIGLNRFPDGGAPASRFRAHALGLKIAGADVSIVSFDSETRDDDQNIERIWDWKGITCYGYNDPNRDDKNITIKRIANRLRGRRNYYNETIKIYDRVSQLCHDRQIDAVMGYNQDLTFANRLIRICRAFNVLFVQSYAEFMLPEDFPDKSFNMNYLRCKYHMKFIPKRNDGSVVISERLGEIVRKAGSPSSVLIPALTGVNQIQPLKPKSRKSDGAFTLCYLGGGFRRDSLETALKAVAESKKRNHPIKLIVCGANKGRIATLNQLSTELKIESLVEINGWMEEEKLRDRLSEADAFILLRTDDQSSKCCFPTRLPELIQYGRPIILTSIQDYTLYFKDFENAALIPPGDADALLEKIEILEKNPDLRARLAESANALLTDAFGYEKNGRILYDYLKSLQRESGERRGEGRAARL